MNKKEMLQGLLFLAIIVLLILAGGAIDYQFIQAGYVP